MTTLNLIKNFTPGPLTVKTDTKWPFDIKTYNASDEVVAVSSMPAYTTRQTTSKECMSGRFMTDQYEARVLNHCCYADQVLRATAPEMFDLLYEIYVALEVDGNVTSNTKDKIRDVLEKATKGYEGE
jgi:hypothetical protein